MKLCITSQGDNLDSQIDPRFGRCAYFIIIDPDTLGYEVVENKAAQSGGGAGIQSGQLMNEYGVQAVITGNVGPNAFQTLNAANIQVITGVSGTIKEAINRYKNGELNAVNNPTVDSHFGMK
jgi:predicted Fe-Mo cluster-binding NifX family protein